MSELLYYRLECLRMAGGNIAKAQELLKFIYNGVNVEEEVSLDADAGDGSHAGNRTEAHLMTVQSAQEGEAFDALMKEWKGECKGEGDWMQMKATSHSTKPTAVAYSAREGEEFQPWPAGRPYPIAAIKFDDGSIFDLIIGRWR